MVNFILVQNDGSADLHTLYWKVPFTAEEMEKIYEYKRVTHGKIVQLDFEPTDIPHSVRLDWILPEGVRHYRNILKEIEAEKFSLASVL